MRGAELSAAGWESTHSRHARRAGGGARSRAGGVNGCFGGAGAGHETECCRALTSGIYRSRLVSGGGDTQDARGTQGESFMLCRGRHSQDLGDLKRIRVVEQDGPAQLNYSALFYIPCVNVVASVV